MRFRGQSIADMSAQPISKAVTFFENQPTIARQLQTLVDVGLGYVRLGQPAPTLSKHGPRHTVGKGAPRLIRRVRVTRGEGGGIRSSMPGPRFPTR